MRTRRSVQAGREWARRARCRGCTARSARGHPPPEDAALQVHVAEMTARSDVDVFVDSRADLREKQSRTRSRPTMRSRPPERAPETRGAGTAREGPGTSDSSWEDPTSARLSPITAARILNDASCGRMATVAAARAAALAHSFMCVPSPDESRSRPIVAGTARRKSLPRRSSAPRTIDRSRRGGGPTRARVRAASRSREYRFDRLGERLPSPSRHDRDRRYRAARFRLCPPALVATTGFQRHRLEDGVRRAFVVRRLNEQIERVMKTGDVGAVAEQLTRRRRGQPSRVIAKLPSRLPSPATISFRCGCAASAPRRLRAADRTVSAAPTRPTAPIDEVGVGEPNARRAAGSARGSRPEGDVVDAVENTMRHGAIRTAPRSINSRRTSLETATPRGKCASSRLSSG